MSSAAEPVEALALADVPAWVYDIASADDERGTRAADIGTAPDWFRDADESPVNEGSRHDTATRMAGWLVGPARYSEARAMAFMADWNQRVCRPPLPLDELERVVSDIREADEGGTGGRATLPSMAPLNVREVIESIRRMPPGVSTGYERLDRIGIRLRPEELMVIAGRQASAKTTMMANLCLSLPIRTEGPIVFFTLEMSQEGILGKLLAALTGRNSGGEEVGPDEIREILRVGAENGLEDGPVRSAIDQLVSLEGRLRIEYAPHVRADEMQQLCAGVHDESGALGAVLVDYLQIVPAPRGSHDRRDIEVASVCRELKHLAVDLRCPVVAACQVNRQGTRDTDFRNGDRLDSREVRRELARRRPRIHHLRESDAIAQFADIVLGLQDLQGEFVDALPPDLQEENERGSGPLLVRCLKNRLGRTRSAELLFRRKSGAILDPDGLDDLLDEEA